MGWADRSSLEPKLGEKREPKGKHKSSIVTDTSELGGHPCGQQVRGSSEWSPGRGCWSQQWDADEEVLPAHLSLLATRIWGCHGARGTPGSASAPPGTSPASSLGQEHRVKTERGDSPRTGSATGMVPGPQGHGAPPAQALGSVLSQTRVPRTLIDGEPSHAGPGLFSNPSVINDLFFGQSHLD